MPEPMRLAVNLSALQLRGDALVDSVRSALAGAGLPAERLELEVTETVLMQDAPRYLAQALWQRNGSLLALALDMSVPPLALLASLCATYAMLGAVVAWQTAVVWPLLVGVGACAALLSAAVQGWMLVGKAWVRGHELLLVPVYILRKLPLYLAFLFKRQVAWVKTRRD